MYDDFCVGVEIVMGLSTENLDFNHASLQLLVLVSDATDPVHLSAFAHFQIHVYRQAT